MPHERCRVYVRSLYYKDVTAAGTSFLAVKDVQGWILYLRFRNLAYESESFSCLAYLHRETAREAARYLAWALNKVSR